MRNEDLLKDFAATSEYKAWEESLLALIGYLKDKELDDSELINVIMANHMDSSFKLSRALKAKNKVEPENFK